MSRGKEFANALSQWVAKGKPYPPKSNDPCYLGKLYLSLTERDKAEAKSILRSKWKDAGEMIMWYMKNRDKCPQTTSGDDSPTSSTPATQSVDWKMVGIGVGVLLLIFLLLWFFVLRR